MSRPTALACALALALSLAACGDDAPAAAPAPATGDAFPREVLGVIVPARPERILSASASHTEMLYALGAGDRVVATDLFSDWPPAAAATDKVDAFNLGVETAAALDPDLVILSFDPGDLADGLGRLGIPVLVFATPSDLEGAYAQMEAVGAALGEDEAAARLVEGMRVEIGAIVAGLPPLDEPPTYYHELDGGLYSITSDTFIGSVYGLAGLVNVADPADEAGYGYPQLSSEFLVAADPDFVFLADTICCGESAATVAARPGWAAMGAVREGRVVELDDAVASRWGPRVVDFLRVVADAVYGTGD